MNDNIIETFDLTKIYKLKGKKGKLKALDNVNLKIKENEIFGLLGPNGAGKTTLVHILTTIKQPTSGYATIKGYNILKYPKKAKNYVGLMLDKKMTYLRITGYSNLKFFCKLYKVPDYKKKIYKIAEEFDFTRWLGQLAENYSTGMRMKLSLMRTLLIERDVLFLDEPTVGLDVEIKSLVIDKIKQVNKTIFLTSHDMGVVEKLCNRIAFINNGKILKIGNKEDLKRFGRMGIKIKIWVNEKKEELE
ncbi:MAG: ABC transporter ATP-binding protein, partial [Promethearchaeota archaeon]